MAESEDVRKDEGRRCLFFVSTGAAAWHLCKTLAPLLLKDVIQFRTCAGFPHAGWLSVYLESESASIFDSLS